eukprot:XP_020393744.1 uncharacterized protein LOC109939811 [Zea mays]
MDGDATALASPSTGTFPDKHPRSENSVQRAPGDSIATSTPPEKEAVDPRTAAIPFYWYVRRRRRRSSLSAGSASAGRRSTGVRRFADRSTLTRSASLELQVPRMADNNTNTPFRPPAASPNTEHSVQEVNSPTKPSDTPGTFRRTKEQNFKPDEDLLLCKTWLEISSDPVISTGQRKEGLWARIEKRYNELRGEFPLRLNRALSSRWDKIRAETGKFAGFYARVLRENQSGLTDNDKTSKAATLYATSQKKPFHFMHYWTRLKNEPKWDAMVHGSPWRGNAGREPVRSLTPTGSVNEVQCDEGGSKGKRPLGRDSTKASRKKSMSSSSQSTDYLSRLHDIQIARLKQSEEKSDLKQQNIEFMKEVELKKLEVKSKEIEVQEKN